MNKSKGFYKGTGKYRKITITITPDLEAFLDSLRKQIRDLGGKSLGRTEIIRAALEYLSQLNIDLKNIADEEDLLQKLLKATKKPK